MLSVLGVLSVLTVMTFLTGLTVLSVLGILSVLGAWTDTTVRKDDLVRERMRDSRLGRVHGCMTQTSAGCADACADALMLGYVRGCVCGGGFCRVSGELWNLAPNIGSTCMGTSILYPVSAFVFCTFAYAVLLI